MDTSTDRDRSFSRSASHDVMDGLGNLTGVSQRDFTTLSQAKAVLLGDVAAGKTSLLNALRFKRSRLAAAGSSGRTIGIEVHSVSLSHDAKLWFYDFGGHETYHYSHQMFLSDKAIYLITVDIATYTPEQFDKSVGYWYDILTSRLVGPMMCVLATHTDLVDQETQDERCYDIMQKIHAKEISNLQTIQKELDFVNGLMYKDQCGESDPIRDFRSKSLERPQEQLQRLLDNRPHVYPKVITVSSKTMEGVPEFNDSLLQIMRNESHKFPVNRIPSTWIDLGEAMAKTRHKLPFLTKTEFYSLAQEHGVRPENVPFAFRYLQAVGVILHYEDNKKDSPLRDFVFNNPNLLLAIFGLIFNHNYYQDEIRFVWSNKSMLRLPKIDFENLRLNLRTEAIAGEKLLRCFWNSTGINDSVFDVILSLLEKFDLCYEIPSFGKKHLPEGRNFRFPYLLKPMPPSDVLGIWTEELPMNTAEYRLLLCLNTRGLPLGFMEKVSVRINAFLDHRVDWKFGMVAFCNSGQDLIKLEAHTGIASGVETCDISLVTRTRKERGTLVRNMVLVIVATINKILTRQYPGILGYWYVQCGHCVQRSYDGTLKPPPSPTTQGGSQLDSFPADNFVFATPLAMRWQFQCRNCEENEWLSVGDVFPTSEELQRAEPGPEYNPENEPHAVILSRFSDDLQEQMDAKFLISILLKKGMLNVTTAAMVSSRRTKQSRNKALFEILQQAPEKNFLQFCDILRKEGDLPRLADVLEAALNQEKLRQGKLQDSPPDGKNHASRDRKPLQAGFENILASTPVQKRQAEKWTSRDEPPTKKQLDYSQPPPVPARKLPSDSSDYFSPDEFRQPLKNISPLKEKDSEDKDSDENEVFDDSVEMQSDSEGETETGEHVVQSFDALSKYIEEVKDLKDTLPLMEGRVPNTPVMPDKQAETERFVYSTRVKPDLKPKPVLPPKPKTTIWEKPAKDSKPLPEKPMSPKIAKVDPINEMIQAALGVNKEEELGLDTIVRPEDEVEDWPTVPPPPPPTQIVTLETQKSKEKSEEKKRRKSSKSSDDEEKRLSREIASAERNNNGGVPESRVPVSQAPVSQVQVSQAPMSRSPVSQVHVSQAPVSQAPVSQVHVSQAPVSQVHMSQAPVSQVQHVPRVSAPRTSVSQVLDHRPPSAHKRPEAPPPPPPSQPPHDDDFMKRYPHGPPPPPPSQPPRDDDLLRSYPHGPPPPKPTTAKPVIPPKHVTPQAKPVPKPRAVESVRQQEVQGAPLRTIVEESVPQPARRAPPPPQPRKELFSSSTPQPEQSEEERLEKAQRRADILKCQMSPIKAPSKQAENIVEAAEATVSEQVEIVTARYDAEPVVTMIPKPAEHKFEPFDMAQPTETEVQINIIPPTPENDLQEPVSKPRASSKSESDELVDSQSDESSQPAFVAALLVCKDDLLKAIDAKKLVEPLKNRNVISEETAEKILSHKTKQNRNKRLLQVLKQGEERNLAMFCTVLRHKAGLPELAERLETELSKKKLERMIGKCEFIEEKPVAEEPMEVENQTPEVEDVSDIVPQPTDNNTVTTMEVSRPEEENKEDDKKANVDDDDAESVTSSVAADGRPAHVNAILACKDRLMEEYDSKRLVNHLITNNVITEEQAKIIKKHKTKTNRNKRLLQFLKKNDEETFLKFCDVLKHKAGKPELADELLNQFFAQYENAEQAGDRIPLGSLASLDTSLGTSIGSLDLSRGPSLSSLPPDQSEMNSTLDASEVGSLSSTTSSLKSYEPHVLSLLANKDSLVNKIDAKKLTDGLVKKGVIDEAMAEEITARKSKTNRNKKMLQALKVVDEPTFFAFCDVLETEGNKPKMAELLRNTCQHYKETKQRSISFTDDVFAEPQAKEVAENGSSSAAAPQEAFPSIDQAVEALEAARPQDVGFALGYRPEEAKEVQEEEVKPSVQEDRYRPGSFVLEETDLDSGMFGVEPEDEVINEAHVDIASVEKTDEAKMVKDGSEGGSSNDMPAPHVATLLTCKETLLNDLNGKKLSECMLRRGLFTEETTEEIKSKKSKLNRNKKLLQALKHSDEDVFLGFCDVLHNEGKQAELASLLDDTFKQFQSQDGMDDNAEEPSTENQVPKLGSALEDDIPSIDVETEDASPRESPKRDSEYNSPPTDIWSKTRAVNVKNARAAFFSESTSPRVSWKEEVVEVPAEPKVPPPVPDVPPPDDDDEAPPVPPRRISAEVQKQEPEVKAETVQAEAKKETKPERPSSARPSSTEVKPERPSSARPSSAEVKPERPSSTEVKTGIVTATGTVTRRMSFNELQAEKVAVDDDDQDDINEVQTDIVLQKELTSEVMKAENVSIHSTESTQEIHAEVNESKDDIYEDTVEEHTEATIEEVSTEPLVEKPVEPTEPNEEVTTILPKHVLAVQACKQQLLDELDAKNLTDLLVNRKIMDEAEAQEIKARKSKLNRNKKLVQFLQGSDEKVFLGFCNVLKYDSGLEELSDQLLQAYSSAVVGNAAAAMSFPDEEESSVPEKEETALLQPGTSVDSLNVGSMENLADDPTKYPPHVKTILASKDMLLNELESNSIVAEMVKRGAISQEVGDSVTSKKSKLNRNKRLLQLLKKEDEEVFGTFCQVLRAKPKTENIAEVLESTLYYHKIQGENLEGDVSGDVQEQYSPAAGLERSTSDVSLTLSTSESQEPHVAALITHKTMLYQDMDAKKLVGNLHGTLTQEQTEEILSKKSKINRNKKLLQCLRNADVNAFNAFCESLRQHGKGEIADQLQATMAEHEQQGRVSRSDSMASVVSDISIASSTQMEPHVAAILACKETLLNDIDAKKLVEAMKAKQCIDESAVDDIRARKSKINRNKKLLQHLKKVDEAAFSAFIQVLHEQKKTEVADTLARSWADYRQLEEQSRKANLARSASDASIVSDVSATQPTQCPPYVAAILVNKDLLLNDIDMKLVVSPMLEKGYLTEEAASAILARKSKLNRNKKMLQVLKNSDERVFNGFCDTLRSENQHKIADELAKAWYQYEVQHEEKTEHVPEAAVANLARTESQHSVQSDISTASLSDKPAHVATILTCRDMLLNEIDAKKLVGPMVAQGTMEEDVMTAVLERKTKVNRNKMLVQVLKKGDERIFNSFCDALRGQKKYTNIAEILEQTFMNFQMQGAAESEAPVEVVEPPQPAMGKATSETSITSETEDGASMAPHQRTILSCKETLLKDMDAKVIVQAMQQRGAVSAPMVEGVTSRKSKLNRNKKLLQLLKHSDENTFKTFCDVLKNEGSLPIIAEMLESTLYYNQLQGDAKPLDDEQEEEGGLGMSSLLQKPPGLTRTLSDLSDTSGVSLASGTPFSNQPPPALAILTCKDDLMDKMDALAILEDMGGAGAIDEGSKGQVASRKTKVNRNKKLLQMMKQSDDHTFRAFCAAVRRTGQERLATSLELSFEHYKSVNVHADEVFNPHDVTGDTSFDMASVSMDERQGVSPTLQSPHMIVLALHRETLMTEFDAKKVVKPLIAQGAIPEDTPEDVLSRKSKHNRNKKMLQLLKRMPEETFVSFCQVLKVQGKAPSLAETLLQSLSDIKSGQLVIEESGEEVEGAAQNGKHEKPQTNLPDDVTVGETQDLNPLHKAMQPSEVPEQTESEEKPVPAPKPKKKRSASRDKKSKDEDSDTASTGRGRSRTSTEGAEETQDSQQLKPKPKKRQKSKSPRRSKSKDRTSEENIAVAQSTLPEDIQIQHEDGTIKLSVGTPIIIADNIQPSFMSTQPGDAAAISQPADAEEMKQAPSETSLATEDGGGTLSRADSEDMLDKPPHVLALLASKNDLLQGMDAKYLIGPMLNRGLVSNDAAAQVTSRKSILNRNKKLLQFLRHINEDSFHVFCTILQDEGGLPQLADTLQHNYQQYSGMAQLEEQPQQQQQQQQQQQPPPPEQQQQQYHHHEEDMESTEATAAAAEAPPHVTALLSCKEQLLAEIDAKKLMPHLLAQNIISEEASEEVLSRKSKTNRNKLLLQVLKKADDRAFRNFCDVLRYDGGKAQVAQSLEHVYQKHLPTVMSDQEQGAQAPQDDSEEPPVGVTLWRGRSAETLL